LGGDFALPRVLRVRPGGLDQPLRVFMTQRPQQAYPHNARAADARRAMPLGRGAGTQPARSRAAWSLTHAVKAAMSSGVPKSAMGWAWTASPMPPAAA